MEGECVPDTDLPSFHSASEYCSGLDNLKCMWAWCWNLALRRTDAQSFQAVQRELLVAISGICLARGECKILSCNDLTPYTNVPGLRRWTEKLNAGFDSLVKKINYSSVEEIPGTVNVWSWCDGGAVLTGKSRIGLIQLSCVCVCVTAHLGVSLITAKVTSISNNTWSKEPTGAEGELEKFNMTWSSK